MPVHFSLWKHRGLRDYACEQLCELVPCISSIHTLTSLQENLRSFVSSLMTQDWKTGMHCPKKKTVHKLKVISPPFFRPLAVPDAPRYRLLALTLYTEHFKWRKASFCFLFRHFKMLPMHHEYPNWPSRSPISAWPIRPWHVFIKGLQWCTSAIP